MQITKLLPRVLAIPIFISVGHHSVALADCPSFDLRQQPYSMANTKVNDQGKMGTCYAHAIVKVFEGILKSTGSVPPEFNPSVMDFFVRYRDEAKLGSDPLQMYSGGKAGCREMGELLEQGICSSNELETSEELRRIFPRAANGDLELLRLLLLSGARHFEPARRSARAELETLKHLLAQKEGELEAATRRIEASIPTSSRATNEPAIPIPTGVGADFFRRPGSALLTTHPAAVTSFMGRFFEQSRPSWERMVRLSGEQWRFDTDAEFQRLKSDVSDLSSQVGRLSAESRRIDRALQFEQRGLSGWGSGRSVQVAFGFRRRDPAACSQMLEPGEPFAALCGEVERIAGSIPRRRLDTAQDWVTTFHSVIKRWVDQRCSGRRVKLPEAFRVGCEETGNASQFEGILNQVATSGVLAQPVLVNLNGRLFSEAGTSNHGALIVAQFEDQGTCKVRVQNSYGADCEFARRRGWDCENGVFTIGRAELLRHTDGLKTFRVGRPPDGYFTKDKNGKRLLYKVVPGFRNTTIKFYNFGSIEFYNADADAVMRNLDAGYKIQSTESASCGFYACETITFEAPGQPVTVYRQDVETLKKVFDHLLK